MGEARRSTLLIAPQPMPPQIDNDFLSILGYNQKAVKTPIQQAITYINGL